MVKERTHYYAEIKRVRRLVDKRPSQPISRWQADRGMILFRKWDEGRMRTCADTTCADAREGAEVLMCPHCGWQYDPEKHARLFPGEPSPHELVPGHVEFWDGDTPHGCPGSHQHPRNPESDRRPPTAVEGPAPGGRAGMSPTLPAETPVVVTAHALPRWTERFDPAGTAESLAAAVRASEPAPAWVRRPVEANAPEGRGRRTHARVWGEAVFLVCLGRGGVVTVVTALPLHKFRQRELAAEYRERRGRRKGPGHPRPQYEVA